MPFSGDDGMLWEKYKTIWTKIEDLNIELNALLIYDDKYIKTEIRTYDEFILTSVVCPRKWSRIWIFYNLFYWFFICLWKQILPVNIFIYTIVLIKTQTSKW